MTLAIRTCAFKRERKAETTNSEENILWHNMISLAQNTEVMLMLFITSVQPTWNMTMGSDHHLIIDLKKSLRLSQKSLQLLKVT